MQTNLPVKEEVIGDFCYENDFGRNDCKKSEEVIGDFCYENDFGRNDCNKSVINNSCGSAGAGSNASLFGKCSTSGSKPENNVNLSADDNNKNLKKASCNYLNNNKSRKSSTVIRRNLELHLSDSQRSKIEAILDSVKELSDTEKLLLYLKLPTREHNTPSTLTNTKQEQTFAFQWIRNNLEECDNSVNLPKHEVYDEYRAYCEAESLTRFLSAPDFGKIVKCIFPNVKARRLGTRGNSKYCYNGLQRKIFKDTQVFELDNNKPYNQPLETDVIDNKNIELEGGEKMYNQTYAAASILVCEWANKLLGRVFQTLIGLAKFLVSGSYVSTKSMAAFIVMAASEESIRKITARYSLETSVPRIKNEVIKTEVASPLASNSHSIESDILGIQSNVVNSTSDMKSMSNVIPSVGVQVVPDMLIENSDLQKGSISQGSDLKLEQFTIDVSAPVYLGNSSTECPLPCRLNNEDVVMDNVNLVIMDKKQDANLCPGNLLDDLRSIPEISLSNSSNSHVIAAGSNNLKNSSGSVKRRKKKIEKLQLKSPHTKSSKMPSRSQFSDLNNINAYIPQPSFSCHPSMPPPTAALPMQMQRNQYSWPMSSVNMTGSPDQPSPSEKEMQNIFLSNEPQLNFVSNIQRCQSVPLSKPKCIETDQPLTPQFNATQSQSVYSSDFKQTFKAKRNLFTLFNNDTSVPIMNALGKDFLMNNGSTLQNVPNIMPTLNSKANLERVVPSEPLKQMCPFNSIDMMMQVRQDLSHEDDFSGIPSNLEHVDGHELLKTFQSSENLFNDWNTMTMPVMNFS